MPAQAFSFPAAVITGAIGGWLFYRLWRALLPAGRSRAFWVSVPQSVRGMVTTEEPSEVLHHYKHLMATTARYTGRSLIAVLVGVLPASVIFLLLDAWVSRESHRNPFSPLLNDLELAFFVAVMLGSIGAAWWHRGRGARPA